jgi:hypothetical protein
MSIKGCSTYRYSLLIAGAQYIQKNKKTAQPAAAADPRQEHAGAGFGQGSKREHRITFLEFLLK